jgi:hypothetical protein
MAPRPCPREAGRDYHWTSICRSKTKVRPDRAPAWRSRLLSKSGNPLTRRARSARVGPGAFALCATALGATRPNQWEVESTCRCGRSVPILGRADEVGEVLGADCIESARARGLLPQWQPCQEELRQSGGAVIFTAATSTTLPKSITPARLGVSSESILFQPGRPGRSDY